MHDSSSGRGCCRPFVMCCRTAALRGCCEGKRPSQMWNTLQLKLSVREAANHTTNTLPPKYSGVDTI